MSWAQQAPRERARTEIAASALIRVLWLTHGTQDACRSCSGQPDRILAYDQRWVRPGITFPAPASVDLTRRLGWSLVVVVLAGIAGIVLQHTIVPALDLQALTAVRTVPPAVPRP